MGLRIRMQLQPYTKDQGDTDLYLGMLNASCGDDRRRIALVLRKLETKKYARVAADSFEDRIPTSESTTTTLYIEHTSQIPLPSKSRLMHCFHFRRSSSEAPVPSYGICDIYPGQLTTYEGDVISIPRVPTRPRSIKPFSICIRLDPVQSQYDNFTVPPPMYLTLGYHSAQVNTGARCSDRENVDGHSSRLQLNFGVLHCMRRGPLKIAVPKLRLA
jgi:hypothetical protein